MIDDRSDPLEGENNVINKGENCRNILEQGRWVECKSDKVGLRWEHEPFMECNEGITEHVQEVNSCRQVDLVLGIHRYSLLMVLNGYMLH